MSKQFLDYDGLKKYDQKIKKYIQNTFILIDNLNWSTDSVKEMRESQSYQVVDINGNPLSDEQFEGRILNRFLKNSKDKIIPDEYVEPGYEGSGLGEHYLVLPLSEEEEKFEKIILLDINTLRDGNLILVADGTYPSRWIAFPDAYSQVQQLCLVSFAQGILESGDSENSLVQKSVIPDEEFNNNVASQWWAASFGRNTKATNYSSFATGTRTINNGDSALVGGVENEVKEAGMASISTGVGNINEGRSSIVAGEDNRITAGARGSLTVGHNNTSDSSGGVTGGKHNDNHGDNSLCVGECLKTNWKNKNVVGVYNNDDDTGDYKYFVVGNGYEYEGYDDGTNIRTIDISPALSINDVLILDVKMTSDDIRFMLGDGWNNYLGYFIISKSSPSHPYNGVEVSDLEDGYKRIYITPSEIGNKQGTLSKINLLYFSRGTGLFRINPKMKTIEKRQNAFEVYEDGTVVIPEGTKGVKIGNTVLTEDKLLSLLALLNK